MRLTIALLASTVFVQTYGFTYVFSNKISKAITITAKLRSLKKGIPGQVICQVTVPGNQSVSCDSGNQCPEVLHVIIQDALQGQTFNIKACQNTEFIFGQSKYTSLDMVSLEEKAIK